MEYVNGHEKTPIQKFYSNEVIFITGGTGFVGLTLIEKILRACGDTKKIYLLIRNKKGKSSEDRLKDLFTGMYWKTLHLLNPNFKDKLSVMNGDLLERNLGLSVEDQEIIINQVLIIFGVTLGSRLLEDIEGWLNGGSSALLEDNINAVCKNKIQSPVYKILNKN